MSKNYSIYTCFGNKNTLDKMCGGYNDDNVITQPFKFFIDEVYSRLKTDRTKSVFKMLLSGMDRKDIAEVIKRSKQKVAKIRNDEIIPTIKKVMFDFEFYYQVKQSI